MARHRYRTAWSSAVIDVERAFAQIWAMLGEPMAIEESIGSHDPVAAGVMHVRIVASLPSTAGMIRMDQLLAALAREPLAVLYVPACLLPAGNRSNMTQDVLCPGFLPLLFAPHSHCGQNLTFATHALSVSALSKRIHVEC